MSLIKRRSAWDTFVVLLAGLLMSAPLATYSTELPDEPWLMPFDVLQKHRPDVDNPIVPIPTQEEIYDFAWQSFIALNWPYKRDGKRGRPDRSGKLAPIRNNGKPHPPVVWETYMAPGTVFTDPEGWDVKWSTPDFENDRTGLRLLEPPTYNGIFAPGINQPYTHANVPTGPVIDQNRNYLRYEVTLNQSFFTYIKQFSYYDADIQKRAVGDYVDFAWTRGTAPTPVSGPHQKAKYFQPLPTGLEFYVDDLRDFAQQGIVEVKAAWKILKTEGENADVPGRYYRSLLRFKRPDGTTTEPLLVGLVGLHIHRVTPFGHLPSTFEHVDNVKLVRKIDDPLFLPATPSLNPGMDSASPPPYPNGYEVGGLSGQAGIIPKAIVNGDPTILVQERKQVNVSRSTPIPEAVQQVNEKYQGMLDDTVWRYYQLIGTQNPNVTIPNEHLGPGIPGPQYSNVQNLVNTTLESYTQPGNSCAGCHINAFPQGVDTFPPYEPRFRDLHVMSFLLLNAKSADPQANSAANYVPDATTARQSPANVLGR